MDQLKFALDREIQKSPTNRNRSQVGYNANSKKYFLNLKDTIVYFQEERNMSILKDILGYTQYRSGEITEAYLDQLLGYLKDQTQKTLFFGSFEYAKESVRLHRARNTEYPLMYFMTPDREFSPRSDFKLQTFNNIYLHLDCIENTYFGAKSGNIYGKCSITNLSQQPGEQIDHRFREIWVPVNKNRIETINITLTDDAGNEIKFASGDVVCQIIFKRVI